MRISTGIPYRLSHKSGQGWRFAGESKAMQEVNEPIEVHQFCKNVDHWGEMILFGKCKLCGGEIMIHKSDIPKLARDIEFGQMQEPHCYECARDGEPCEEVRSQTQSEAYHLANS
jgi:hypothetical protein